MPALDQLAIIIPAGPGDRAWHALLPQLRGLPDAAELRVVGVAEDAPAGFPEAVRAQWIDSPRGRARQQNAGARASRNAWLWFLHADSRLHPDTLARIAALPDQPALAYFDLAFHDGPPLMTLNRWGAWIRCRTFGLPFGDQGLLLPRARFEVLGGFDETLEGGEDHALVWRARRAGLPLKALGLPLYTSARKYVERGWWATTRRHLGLTWQQARRFSRIRA